MLRAASEIKTEEEDKEIQQEEKRVEKKMKDKYGQFYNWAFNTPGIWGEVKWLRGY